MGRGVLHDAIAAIPNDEGDTDRADQIDERKKDRIVKDRLDVGTAILIVDAIKGAYRLRFSVENLDRLRSGKVFLQERIDPRDARTHQVVALPRAPAKPSGRGEEQRN